MKKYVRDKRSPIPSSEMASKLMSAISGKNTKPEVTLRKLLWNTGNKGYRLHPTIPGRPDIVFPKQKVAIFVHGCYWHRCPHCNLPYPKSNTSFWLEKFAKNKNRDLKKELQLKAMGWTVIVIWECEIKKDPKGAVQRILTKLSPV